MNEIVLGLIGVGIAFLIISLLIAPVASWIEKSLERWLKWREVREAVAEMMIFRIFYYFCLIAIMVFPAVLLLLELFGLLRVVDPGLVKRMRPF